jgi:hypothetical protein
MGKKNNGNGNSKTAIMKVADYRVLTIAPEHQSKLIEANLGPQAIVGEMDLARVRMPSGDTMRFTMPGIGKTDLVETFTGVVIYNKIVRLYWETEYGKGPTTPPDCSSDLGFVGIGNPGGNCQDCPLKQFSDDRSPPPCSERRVIFILTPTVFLPIVLSLPPTSLKAGNKYFRDLMANGLFPWSVSTKFGLSPDRNAGGITFGRVTFEAAELLTPGVVEKFEAINEQLRPHFEQFSAQAAVRDDGGAEGGEAT